jgi:hypothetical protein
MFRALIDGFFGLAANTTAAPAVAVEKRLSAVSVGGELHSRSSTTRLR